MTAALRTTQVAGLMLVAGYVLFVERLAVVASYEAWSAVVVVPLVLMVDAWLIAHLTRRDPEPWLRRVLVLAIVLKMLATVARYAAAFVVYDVSDAEVYHDEGARLAASYREGDFGAELGRDLIGTGFVRLMTGLLYAVTGPSPLVAYAVWSSLGFWGGYCLYRAFETGVPGGSRRLYGLLLLCLPSMLFWPSGLGKESLMLFGIGLFAMGAARRLQGCHGWSVPALLGLATTAMVRPHVTAALFAAAAAAVLLQRSDRTGSGMTAMGRLGLLGAMSVLGVLLLNRTAQFLDVEDLSVSEAGSMIAYTQQQTSDGSSQFSAAPVGSVADLPGAMLTVLVRPFLFEATSIQVVLAALEGTLLLFLLVRTLPRVGALVGMLRDRPYLLLCTVYVLLFVYAFSGISNFGILTRQRVQVLPFVLCLVTAVHTTRRPATRSAALAREVNR